MTQSSFDIANADLTSPDVIALLELHHAEMVHSSPPGTCHVLDLSGLKTPDVEVYAARLEGTLCAIGALKHHDGFGEVKSMRAHPDARGTGAGKAMLEFLIDRGREVGFASLKLETGSTQLDEPARGLYRAYGFEPCGDFADYKGGDFNKLFSLELA
ncbi:MAG: GNAT family N-acetyltransferase [Pseudomonadota bacterium]